MSLEGAEDQCWYDACREQVEEIFSRSRADSMDRSRIEEELLSLVENFGAYLMLADEGGECRLLILRRSSTAYGALWIRDIESGASAKRIKNYAR
jgi:hypothetical protein